MKEEDRLLLSSLGVISANPDDIERDVISKAKIKSSEHGIQEIVETDIEQISEVKNGVQDKLFREEVEIHAQLRAVNTEIDAIAEELEAIQSVANKDGSEPSGSESDKESSMPLKKQRQFLIEGGELQAALVTERLRSLKQKKIELEKQLQTSNVGSIGQQPDVQKLLSELVKDANINEPKKGKRGRALAQPVKANKRKKNHAALQEDADLDTALDAVSSGFIETERDKLIRQGLLTPFDQVRGFERRVQRSSQARDSNSSDEDRKTTFSASTKSRHTTVLLDAAHLPKLDPPTQEFRWLKKPVIRKETKESDNCMDDQIKESRKRRRRPLPENYWRKAVSRDDELSKSIEFECNDSSVEQSGLDIDKGRSNKHDFMDSVDSDNSTGINEDTAQDSDDDGDNVILEGGLKIPGKIYDSLFDYQKTGVKWLWELHCQRAGGIIGDEMGLGKTIQVISFLASLHFSGMYKPSIIVCPLTLLRQWRREVRKWYPKLHVTILHDSVSIPAAKRNKQDKNEDDDEASSDSEYEETKEAKSAKRGNKWDELITHVAESKSGLLITTYEQLRLLQDKLLAIDWGYAILDEGHRIRNPNAEITLVCKQLQTVHRIIMTGAPIQNKLAELWSLFDFVFPGKLGVLPVFEAEFAAPIKIGGYANANPLQVSTAYRCAVVLRDLIMPYLLRRMKTDVDANLTKKTEHVLFCTLTETQRRAYRAFLASSDVEQILDGSRNSLYGIDVLRKICNHPDLLERNHSSSHPDYGNPERSGKLKVVVQVLKVWKDQGHRVLIFTQTQQMLDIIENYLVSEGLTYRRMDGQTPAKHRASLMDEFNQSTHVFVFILTTKVGGLGTNLIGADRVILFDPDWNPSTDMQARERAWRIGQTRDVTVYRLITRGTIEEKVYHRQIYKHFLTNKILKNPNQRRFFKARDMRDLFTLQDDLAEDKTETSNIFKEIEGELKFGDHGNHASHTESLPTSHDKMNPMDEKSTKGSDLEAFKLKGKAKIEEGETSSNSDESDILKNLLGSGIHSAINHDAIWHINDEEKANFNNEAYLVAQRAAAALKESRMLRSQDSVSIPTWTGKSGTAGAPESVRRRFGSTINSRVASSSMLNEKTNEAPGSSVGLAGISSGKALSSGDLLARIRKNRQDAIVAGLDFHKVPDESSSLGNNAGVRSIPNKSSRDCGPPVSIQPEILIRQMCTFIQQNGGSVSSSKIVEHFKDRVPPKDLPLFKKLLKEISVLTKDGGEGKWVLKRDYQIDRSSAG